MSRIGGAFPFPTAQVGEGGQVVTLASGGIFYLPPGEWVVETGAVSCLQFFDPINQLWRNVTAPTCDSQYISTDGYNYRVINMSGIVAGASITNAGSGGTNGIGSVATGATVVFTGPAAGVTATGYAVVGGSVAAPTITQAGSGFLVPPLIVIDPPPPGGIQATATATISSTGTITAINMINVGGGYAATPNFWIIPQFGTYAGGASGSFAAGAIPAPGIVFPANAAPGNQNTSPTGAQLTPVALTGSGTLTGIVLVNYGTGYTGTTIPTVTITGGGLAGGVAATAMMSFSMTSVTLASGGAGFGAGNPPTWESSLGVVALASNNAVYQPRAARGVTTVGAGAVATFVIEDPGFGLQKVPFISVQNTSAIASGVATGTAVVGGINDFCIFQPRVQ
jgi:hypothetical protein